jgi:hypothetical protein
MEADEPATGAEAYPGEALVGLPSEVEPLLLITLVSFYFMELAWLFRR